MMLLLLLLTLLLNAFMLCRAGEPPDMTLHAVHEHAAATAAVERCQGCC
jgi:hypothetical protein